MDRGAKTISNFLRDQKLLALLFDKGCGFCVMKQATDSYQLNKSLVTVRLRIVK